MKKGTYKDAAAVYDLINYCLNHDLRDYFAIYLPVKNNYLELDTQGRQMEVAGMANFWNTFLDIQCRNYGKRLNHYIIGIGYTNQKYTCDVAHLILYALGELFEQMGFPSLVAYQVTKEGCHHIHVLVGAININGDSWYAQNLNTWSIAHYIRYTTNIPMWIVED